MLKYFIALIATSMVMVSCRDSYNEQDIAADLAKANGFEVLVKTFEASRQVPLEGADVTLNIGEDTYTAVSDDAGIVSFGTIASGTGRLSVSKEGFTPSYTNVSLAGLGESSSGRATINLFNTNDPNGAKIRGRITMETDLTNETEEPADGIIVTGRYYDGFSYAYVTATTDSNGEYEITVGSSISSVILAISGFEREQKLYASELNNVKLSPVGAAQVTMVNTVFGFGSAGENASYPVTLQGVSAVCPAPADLATNINAARGLIGSISIVDGGIDDVVIIDGGNYENEPGNKVEVPIVSAGGGSGGKITFDTSVFKDLLQAYANGSYVITPGAGYPASTDVSNFGGGYIEAYWIATGSTNGDQSISLSPRGIYRWNAYLGSGISRRIKVD